MLQAKGVDFAILFNYDYESELDNFKDSFIKYLPFYIRSRDNLSTYEIDEKLDNFLIKQSKKIWKDSNLLPSRMTKVNGIYGELFLDFYMRIVEKNKVILTYANKRSFNSNYETLGIDNVLYSIKDSTIELYLCEAKFMNSEYSSRKGFEDDILGTSSKIGHITKEYLNDYFEFIVSKDHQFDSNDSLILNDYFNKLNIILNNDCNFVDFLIESNTRVNFVFFAIFLNVHKNPDYFIKNHVSLYKVASRQVERLGVTNYTIKIIYIPTDNSSMVIKEGIDGYYEQN